jgi:hypothetical protein
MAYTRVTPQHLVSSDGFEILPGGRFAIIYKEGSQEMEVEVEFGFAPSGKTCVTVAPGAFSAWSNGSRASKDEQIRIEGNFRDAMIYDNLDYFVWDPESDQFLTSAVQ